MQPRPVMPRGSARARFHAAVLLALALSLCPRLSAAGTNPHFIVNTTADDSPTPSNCTTPGGTCTLRDALAASAAAGSGTITFAGSVFPGTTPTPVIQTLSALIIPSNTTITAPAPVAGAPQQTVSVYSGLDDAVFRVKAGTTSAGFSGLYLTQGPPSYSFFSNGVISDGALIITNSEISGFGGGLEPGSAVFNDQAGTLTLIHTTLDGNQSGEENGYTDGGALYNAGVATLIDSAISANGGRYTSGGGIFNAGSLSLLNTTVRNNSISDGGKGGGILNGGTLSITSSSITGNSAPVLGYGSGILNHGTLTVTNSIVADNKTNTIDNPEPPPTEDDCDGSGCPVNATAGNIVGEGLSSTLPGSAAICAGLLSDLPAGTTTDNRGQPRTTRYGSNTCLDSGALQTHYALGFVTQPPAEVPSGGSFSASVQLSESAMPFAVAGIPVSLSLRPSGAGSLTGNTASTDKNGLVTYGGISASTPGQADTLLAVLPVTTNPPPASFPSPATVTATSRSFDVTSAAAPTAPVFSLPTGTYPGQETLTLTDVTAGAAVYYTLDGSTPTANSIPYAGPIQITHSVTVQAIAILGQIFSSVSSATYTIQSPSCVIVDYSKGFTQYALSTSGAAVVNSGNGVLYLTNGHPFEAGSAFFSNLVPVTTYKTDFTFQLLNPHADGMTFTIQSNGPFAMGATGGGLGYAGIPNSAALKFDLFNNKGEGSDSTGLYFNGAFPGVPATDLSPAKLDLHSGHIFAVHITYVANKGSVTITDTVTGASASGSMTGDLSNVVGNSAYVGFTAGTGGLTSTATILTWTFEGGPGCN